MVAKRLQEDMESVCFTSYLAKPKMGKKLEDKSLLIKGQSEIGPVDL